MMQYPNAMQNLDCENALKEKYKIIGPHLDEKARRLWAATEAKSIGWGGITKVAKIANMSPITVRSGLQDIARGKPTNQQRASRWRR